MGSNENKAFHDFSTLDINISFGLSSFAEADIMAARVRAAASRRKGLRASCDPLSQELGIAPNWADAASWFKSQKYPPNLFEHSRVGAALMILAARSRRW